MARPKKPYLMRALFDWMVDSGLTPYVLVAAEDPSVRVPAEYVNDGKIVLNISPSAVRDLSIEERALAFDGRFSGNAYAVRVPLQFVLAIYAKESGEGMMFEAEEAAPTAEREPPPRGPNLKVIK